MKYLWGFFKDTQLAAFGWILLACLAVPLAGMYLLDDLRILMVLGLAAGIVAGLKTKVIRMMGVWAALVVAVMFFAIIMNENLVKAMVVAIFMILSMSAVMFCKWFLYKGLTVTILYFLMYCKVLENPNRLPSDGPILLEGPKEKSETKPEATDDKQEKDDS